MVWTDSTRSRGRRPAVRYYQLPLTWEVIWAGWPAFDVLARHLRQQGGPRIDPNRLVYRTHRETPIGITTVFEVLP